MESPEVISEVNKKLLFSYTGHSPFSRDTQETIYIFFIFHSIVQIPPLRVHFGSGQ